MLHKRRFPTALFYQWNGTKGIQRTPTLLHLSYFCKYADYLKSVREGHVDGHDIKMKALMSRTMERRLSHKQTEQIQTANNANECKH